MQRTIARLTLATPLLALLLALPASAQNLTVLLQRGIYLEETAGDLDGAIQLYRQILASGPEARAYESEAQYHLGACLLRKGDRKQAARAFEELMTKHPEETLLIAKSSEHYVEPKVGYSFTVPNGWGFTTRLPVNGGPGMCSDFQDPEQKGQATICAKYDTTPQSGIDQKMIAGAAGMVEYRNSAAHRPQPGFTLRPGSPFFGWLAGQRELTSFGTFVSGGTETTEWDTWIETEKTRAAVLVFVKTPDLADFQTRFTPILNSIRIP